MRDLFWLAVENCGRLLMEFAMRQREVYLPSRAFDQVVEETWGQQILRKRDANG